MSPNISTIERYLSSKNKLVRLKALKFLFRHPDATPIQLVRGLCSEDNRDFEFLQVYELHYAMRHAWSRLSGVTDDEVYEYLSALHATDPAGNVDQVVHILELLCTSKALKMLKEIYVSAPQTTRWEIEHAIDYVSACATDS